MDFQYIEGGVCAAKGFRANGIHCGIRKNKSKRDLALILSEKEAAAAAVYTTNLVKGAPIAVDKKHLENGRASAIICNSGNANTCNADGFEKAIEMCAMTAKQCGIETHDVDGRLHRRHRNAARYCTDSEFYRGALCRTYRRD